jgi:hypothetical protein
MAVPSTPPAIVFDAMLCERAIPQGAKQLVVASLGPRPRREA